MTALQMLYEAACFRKFLLHIYSYDFECDVAYFDEAVVDAYESLRAPAVLKPTGSPIYNTMVEVVVKSQVQVTCSECGNSGVLLFDADHVLSEFHPMCSRCNCLMLAVELEG